MISRFQILDVPLEMGKKVGGALYIFTLGFKSLI